MLVVEPQQSNDDVAGLLMARVVRVILQSPGNWLIGCKLARPLDDSDITNLLAASRSNAGEGPSTGDTTTADIPTDDAMAA
jgi:hypothetical protein